MKLDLWNISMKYYQYQDHQPAPPTVLYSDLDVVIYNKKNSVYNPTYFAPRFGDEIFTTAGERLSIID